MYKIFISKQTNEYTVFIKGLESEEEIETYIIEDRIFRKFETTPDL